MRAALAGWLEEAAAPPLFYDLHAAASHCGAAAMPPLEAVQKRLAALGHVAVRTHFARAGIKTDAGSRQLLELIGCTEHHAGAASPSIGAGYAHTSGGAARELVMQ